MQPVWTRQRLVRLLVLMAVFCSSNRRADRPFLVGFGAHLDGHVGDCEEIVELDAKRFVQLFLVLGLQCRLFSNRKGVAKTKTETRANIGGHNKLVEYNPEPKCEASGVRQSPSV